MYFESHLLATKQLAAHNPIFVRHNLFCGYFMNHKQIDTAQREPGIENDKT
jgi:hypothetical protein